MTTTLHTIKIVLFLDLASKMKISSSFNRLYWGAIIGDIERNLEYLVWNNIKFNLKAMNKDSIHKLLKIITYNNKSLTDMTSKEVVEYLEEIKVLLADNQYTLEIDNQEWERLIGDLK